MNNRISFFALCIILCSSCATAQTITLSNANLKLKNDYKDADYAYALGKTRDAVDILEGTVAGQPRFVDAWWLLGNIYFESLRKFDSAIICFDKVKELKSNYHPSLDYKRGEAYMYAGRYAEARKIFASISPEILNEANKRQVENYIKSCDFAVEAMKHPKKYEPINLGANVNTKWDELMPSTTADERFVFYTRHERIGNYEDENIFMSENNLGNFQKAELVDRPVSTDEYIEGATCVAASGKYLFFTSCGREDAQGRSCDIYFSKRVAGGWDKPRNLGRTVNGPGWDSQPCLAVDGRTVYFASRRLGGYGGADIYVTTLDENSNWTAPVNLGPTINTDKDEERPFIHPDERTLYFSSNGHIGFGKSDFFYTTRDASGAWTTPVNLGYPINTPGDEIGIYITTDGNTAYIGSERPEGFGGMDIYKFDLDESVKPQHVTYLKGRVLDEATKQPLQATLELFELDNDGKRYASLSSDGQTGEFLTTIPYGRDYAFTTNKEGYLFYSGHFSLKDFKTNEPYKMDIYLKKIEVGKSVILNNVFFEVNKFELRAESKAELEVLIGLMQKNPTLTVEIGGHTDNSGIDSENKILSEKRAKSVADYLISKGIVASRLTYKGYGSLKPISDNKTDFGKQQNRRTEFLVTGI